MTDPHPNFAPDDPAAVDTYRRAMRTLREAGVPFMLGGAYSFARYTGIIRHTKDLDVFLLPADRGRALAALAAVGFRTEITYSHWLAKAFADPYFIDLITSSGNGLATVDPAWFAHAVPGEVFDEPVLLCPAEESLWSKAFIMERHRFDGADVAHLLKSAGPGLDWRRLLTRFGPNWRVLYAHLVLFGFVFPAERHEIPGWVMRELNDRLWAELDAGPTSDNVCRGTLLAAMQYLPDVGAGGYADARLAPHGTMTREQVAEWTEGVQTGR